MAADRRSGFRHAPQKARPRGPGGRRVASSTRNDEFRTMNEEASHARLFFIVLSSAFIVALVVLLVWPVAGEQDCALHSDDQQSSFPLEGMERHALCRLAGVVNDPTTSHINPPVLTPIRKPVYDFLLDHVVLTAELVRTLGIGQYTIKRLGAQGFQRDDGQGSEVLVDLLYQNSTQRVYHIQRAHHGKVLLITGEAIIMLTSQTRTGHDGKESVETRMAVYSRLDNPMLATG